MSSDYQSAPRPVSVLFLGRSRALLSYLMEVSDKRGFEVRQIDPCPEAIKKIEGIDPDLLLLEIEPADDQVFSFCRLLRRLYSLPVVACSTDGSEGEVIRAFDAGADDFLKLPLSSVELVARLRANLRRAGAIVQQGSNHNRIISGDLDIRPDEHKVFRHGVHVDLTPTEFTLLLSLVREEGRVVTHSKLMAQVWGPEYVDNRHYLRLYVRYLRAKLEDDPNDPKLILNDWGIGYRFRPTPA